MKVEAIKFYLRPFVKRESWDGVALDMAKDFGKALHMSLLGVCYNKHGWYNRGPIKDRYREIEYFAVYDNCDPADRKHKKLPKVKVKEG